MKFVPLLFTITYAPPFILLIVLGIFYLLEKIIERTILIRIIAILLLLPFAFYTGCVLGYALTNPLLAIKESLDFAIVVSIIVLSVKWIGSMVEFIKFRKLITNYFKREQMLKFSNDYWTVKKLVENYIQMREYERAKGELEKLLKSVQEERLKERITKMINDVETSIKLKEEGETLICGHCKKNTYEENVLCSNCRKPLYPILPQIFFNKNFKIPRLILFIFLGLFLLFTFSLNTHWSFTWLLIWFTLLSLIYEPFGDLKLSSLNF